MSVSTSSVKAILVATPLGGVAYQSWPSP